MMYPEFEKVVGWCLIDRIYERPKLNQQTEIGFVHDLHNLVQVMSKYYQKDYVALTTELKSLFDKLELIADYYPELLDDDVFLGFLSDIFYSGYLPHPVCYCRAQLLEEEDMAEYCFLYLNDPDVCEWMKKNWSFCQPYALIILSEMKTQKIENKEISRLIFNQYRPTFILYLFCLIGLVISFFYGNFLIDCGVFLLLMFLTREILHYVTAVCKA